MNPWPEYSKEMLISRPFQCLPCVDESAIDGRRDQVRRWNDLRLINEKYHMKSGLKCSSCSYSTEPEPPQQSYHARLCLMCKIEKKTIRATCERCHFFLSGIKVIFKLMKESEIVHQPFYFHGLDVNKGTLGIDCRIVQQATRRKVNSGQKNRILQFHKNYALFLLEIQRFFSEEKANFEAGLQKIQVLFTLREMEMSFDFIENEKRCLSVGEDEPVISDHSSDNEAGQACSLKKCSEEKYVAFIETYCKLLLSMHDTPCLLQRGRQITDMMVDLKHNKRLYEDDIIKNSLASFMKTFDKNAQKMCPRFVDADEKVWMISKRITLTELFENLSKIQKLFEVFQDMY